MGGDGGNVTAITLSGGANSFGAAAGTVAINGYTPFNLPTSITKTVGALTNTLTYTYDASHARIVEESTVHGTTLYLGGYERVDRSTASGANSKAVIEHRNYIATPEGIIGIVTTRAPPADGNGAVATGATLPGGVAATELRYWLKDHLGSLVATTDDLGNVQQRFRYDPWGKRICAEGSGALVECSAALHEERGFTGHEMLDEVGLIHMNGRLYDPLTARFLQADPIIQDAMNSQSYNRYSYVLNNPLSFTDPSGFSWWTKWRKTIFSLVAMWIIGPGAWSLSGVMGWGTAGLLNSAALSVVAGGFAAGGIAGGNLESALKGAFFAAVSFGIGEGFQGLGADKFGSIAHAGKVVAHAAVGCARAASSGGSCGSGALSAGFSEVAGPALASAGMHNVLTHAIVGGVASKLGGGSFGEGFATSAFAYMQNHGPHGPKKEIISQLDVGRDAHRTLQDNVTAKSPAFFADLWSDREGTWFGGRPDIGNRETRTLWEIKSAAGAGEGFFQLARYTTVSAIFSPQDTGGYTLGSAAQIFGTSASMTLTGKYGTYTYTSGGDGLILYASRIKPEYNYMPIPMILPGPAGGANAVRSLMPRLLGEAKSAGG